jgi:hypothetical protein
MLLVPQILHFLLLSCVLLSSVVAPLLRCRPYNPERCYHP